jgi:uncharacterized protein YecT (DUF1311 family)
MRKDHIAGFATTGLVAIVLVTEGAAVQAQSFNCRYAKTADEVLICQNSQLSALDEQMSSMFSRLRNNISPAEMRILNREQQFWLRVGPHAHEMPSALRMPTRDASVSLDHISVWHCPGYFCMSNQAR